MGKIDVEEAMDMVDKAGPFINKHYDITRPPWFPKGRTDIALIQRDAEDGHDRNRTVLYIAYNNGTGTKVVMFYDPGKIHGYFHTWSVKVDKEFLIMKVGYEGQNKTLRKKLSDLELLA